MSLVLAFLTAAVWPVVSSFLLAFWGWFVAGGLGLLGLMFSPALRKYTIAILAVLAVLGSLYLYAYNKGYTAPHEPTLIACSEYSSHLQTGPAADKVIKVFKKYHLCA